MSILQDTTAEMKTRIAAHIKEAIESESRYSPYTDDALQLWLKHERNIDVDRYLIVQTRRELGFDKAATRRKRYFDGR